MSKWIWLVCLASLAISGETGRVYASPLKLVVWGGGDSVNIGPNDPATIDVTDGFTGFTRIGGQDLQRSNDTESWTQPVDSSMQVWATLLDGDQTLGSLRFVAPVTGSLSYDGYLDRYSGDAHGSAAAELTLAQGVDPGLVPAWFTRLTATVDSTVTGGSMNNYQSTLTITAAPVPEPASMLVFLVACLVVHHRIRRA